jgi:hypothetical protein
VAERLDLAIAEELGRPVEARERHRGGERIERECALQLRIRRLRPTAVGGRVEGRGGEGRGGEGHILRLGRS